MMRNGFLRTALVMMVAAGGLASRADALAAADRPGTARDHGSTPLALGLACSKVAGCSATASGGTGTGYVFTWSGASYETSDANGHATADVVCGTKTSVRVSATLYDSSWASVSQTVIVNCNLVEP